MKKTQKITYNTSSIHIKLNEVHSNKNNIRIEGLNLLENNTILRIEHSGLTTMIDFTQAKDYQVLYLNKNLEIVGGSYAINNDFGFVLQTQEKNILLVEMQDENTTRILLKGLISKN